MKTNRQAASLTAAVLFSFWFAFADHGTIAGPGSAVPDPIKELQRQRLEAVTAARDELVRQWSRDDLATAVNTNGFVHQLLAANDLVFHARLDVCAGTAERIKVAEEAIKEFEPIVARFEKHVRASIVDSTVPYRLAQAQMLELKITLETAKRETGRP